MLVPLALVFLVVPLIELALIIQVGQGIGVLNTIGLLVLMSAVGAWLVKREGMGVWRRGQAQIRSGRPPAREVVDGVLILFAGALMLTPGFLSDAFGIALLLPPVRAVVRRMALARFLGTTAVPGRRSGRTISAAEVTGVRGRRHPPAA